MKSLYLFLISILLTGCPEKPNESPAATLTPSPAESVAAVGESGGYFSLKLSSDASPGWFVIGVEGARTALVEWDGGRAQFILTAEQGKAFSELSSEVMPLIGNDSKAPQNPPHRVLSYERGKELRTFNLAATSEGALGDMARLLESFLPSQVGMYENHTIGKLEYRDLEGGFYQVTYNKDGASENVVLHGVVPEELKGQQVLVTGTSSEGGMSLEMAGPTFEATQVVAWPPAGGYWLGESVPEGLRGK